MRSQRPYVHLEAGVSLSTPRRLPYRQRQVGWSTHGVSLVVGLGLAGLCAARGLAMAAIVIASLTVAVALLFGWLTVDVDDDALTATFGIGLIRRRVPLDAVTDCRPVRNRWYYGWGIRLIPGGVLWNVSGLDAVELVTSVGPPFRVGTTDPDRLVRAIRERITGRTRATRS